MLKNMSWDLLRLWGQYAEVEPFGSVVENLQRGTIAAMVGNANINPKKTKPFKAQDFLLGRQPTGLQEKKLTREQEWQYQKTSRLIRAKAMVRAKELRTAAQEKRLSDRRQRNKLLIGGVT